MIGYLCVFHNLEMSQLSPHKHLAETDYLQSQWWCQWYHIGHSPRFSQLLTCRRHGCLINIISPIWFLTNTTGPPCDQLKSLLKKQSLSLMPQKSKLTLCVSKPQATVWNSSGLESLRNFPQPYNVSQSTMRNRLLRARNRILLPLHTVPCCWQKSQKATTIYGAVMVRRSPFLLCNWRHPHQCVPRLS